MSENKRNALGFWAGAWRVETDPRRNDGDAIYVFPWGGGTAICEVIARDGEGRNNARVQQAAETTAELIALVPEMVDAILGAASSGDVYRVVCSARKIESVLPRKVEP